MAELLRETSCTVLPSNTVQLHPGYRILAEAAFDVGLTPADPLAQPLEEARHQNESYYRFLGGSPEPVASVMDVTVAGPHGPYRLRVYHPEGSRSLPVTLYFHGGGYVLNGLDTHDSLLRLLANKSGVAICGLAYSKAPEARFPVQLDEARHAISWLKTKGAGFGLDSTRVVLSGDSAGAHLALTAALAERDSGRADLRGLVLAYGMFAPSFDSSSHKIFRQGYGLTSERMRWFWDQFLLPGQDRSHPLVAPVWADLAGLPKTLVLAAAFDCLRDDSLQLSRRLELAGVPNRLSVYDGMQHAFLMAHAWLPPARRAVDEIAETIRDWLIE